MSENILRIALELLDQGKTVALASVVQVKGSVPGKQGARMLVLSDGTVLGTVGGAGLEEKVKQACRDSLVTGKGGVHHFDLQYYKEGGLDSLCGGSVDIVIEVLVPKPHVLICGGGHVAREVSRLLDQLEYAYSIYDDRAEYASKERFPSARSCHVSSPAEFFGSFDLSSVSHILILGYSHKVDTDCLWEACTRFRGWVGVIASKAKKKEMFLRLKARGITDAQLVNVEMPVGLPIGGTTPAEIAVSIMGSIIRNVRRKEERMREASSTVVNKN